MTQETLFDRPDPPIRRSSRDYLLSVAGDYDGMEMWALAPIDRLLQREYADGHPENIEFVWLTNNRHLAWAIVHLQRRMVLCYDPPPKDTAVQRLFAEARR